MRLFTCSIGLYAVIVQELVPQDRDLRLDFTHPELVLAQELLEFVTELARLADIVFADLNGRHEIDVT
ncbi:hypothetical protein QFZ46_002076 [Microbacterium murale]|uniref:Uncharacterized protein n=1 Tax=Microbacterium murale TaxID=1081040 RepID=A0ABU0PB60_9MICO|nr:hypothetical protein [Microbacterium murale]